MKLFMLLSFLTLTSAAFATDLPCDHSNHEAHAEKARAEQATQEAVREPANAQDQTTKDFRALGGAAR